MIGVETRPGVRTLLPGQTPKGEYILAVLLKRSYKIEPSGRCVRADADRPIVTGDKNFGDPMNTTIQFAADFVPFKLATDVVLNGFAHAPQGRPQREILATLEVAQAKKTVRVVGDRVCKHRAGGDPVFSDRCRSSAWSCATSGPMAALMSSPIRRASTCIRATIWAMDSR